MILKIVKVKTDAYGIITNTYIVIDDETNISAVIDPGGESEKIIDVLKSLNTVVKYIILTHGHADHIGALYDLKQYTNAKVLTSQKASYELLNSNINLTNFFNMNLKKVCADINVDDGECINIGKLVFRVILTPGHTEGSLCLYSEKEKVLFSGDTIFAGGPGRTDLLTGNYKQIIDSIKNKLLILPENTVVYPGHDNLTTIKDEISIYKEL